MKSKDAIKFLATVLSVALLLAFGVDQLLEKDRFAFKPEVKRGLDLFSRGFLALFSVYKTEALMVDDPSDIKRKEEARQKLLEMGVSNPRMSCASISNFVGEMSELLDTVCSPGRLVLQETKVLRKRKLAGLVFGGLFLLILPFAAYWFRKWWKKNLSMPPKRSSAPPGGVRRSQQPVRSKPTTVQMPVANQVPVLASVQQAVQEVVSSAGDPRLIEQELRRLQNEAQGLVDRIQQALNALDKRPRGGRLFRMGGK